MRSPLANECGTRGIVFDSVRRMVALIRAVISPTPNSLLIKSPAPGSRHFTLSLSSLRARSRIPGLVTTCEFGGRLRTRPVRWIPCSHRFYRLVWLSSTMSTLSNDLTYCPVSFQVSLTLAISSSGVNGLGKKGRSDFSRKCSVSPNEISPVVNITWSASVECCSWSHI